MNQLHFVGIWFRDDLDCVLVTRRFQKPINTLLIFLYGLFDLGLMLVDVAFQIADLLDEFFKLLIDRVSNCSCFLGIKLVDHP